MIGGRSLQMLVDTGATHGSLPTSFGDQLIADGVATEGPGGMVTLADNSSHRERSIIVNSITIGNHTLNDVHFSLAPDGAEPLLGFSAPSAIGKFTLDAEHGVLAFD